MHYLDKIVHTERLLKRDKLIERIKQLHKISINTFSMYIEL